MDQMLLRVDAFNGGCVDLLGMYNASDCHDCFASRLVDMRIEAKAPRRGGGGGSFLASKYPGIETQCELDF